MASSYQNIHQRIANFTSRQQPQKKSLWQKFLGFMSTLWKTAVKYGKKAMDAVIGFFSKICSAIKNWFKRRRSNRPS